MLCLDTILLRRLGHGDFRSALELRKDTGLLGLVGMELQTERPQSYRVEPVLHHLQRGHLLGHEKHLLASV